MVQLLGGEFILLHTATSTLTTAKRKELADKDEAMPDGSFPIADADDLKKAISTYGLGKNKVADKAWIIKRAKALNLVSQLPAGWVRISHADGEEAFLAFQNVELTLSDPTKSFLKHHGILGMHWGSRKPTATSSGTKSKKSSGGKKKKSKLTPGDKAALTVAGTYVGAWGALSGVPYADKAVNYGKAQVADKYAKKFGTTNYHENVVKNLGNSSGDHAIHIKDENKFQTSRQYLLRQAASQRAAEDALKSIGSAGVRMSKVNGVWKFVAIGAEDAA